MGRRYTAVVSSWKHRAVGFAVVCVLAALPLAATACAMVCRAAETAAALSTVVPVESAHHHHHGASETEHQASSLSGPQLASAGAHDCGAPDDAVPQSEIATPAWRDDAKTNTLLLAAGPSLMSTGSHPLMSRPTMGGQRPPKTASSPAIAALVLRV